MQSSALTVLAMAIPHPQNILSSAKSIKETPSIYKIDAITHENCMHYYQTLNTLLYPPSENHATFV